MDELKYEPVSHDHKAFLKKHKNGKDLARHTMIWKRIQSCPRDVGGTF